MIEQLDVSKILTSMTIDLRQLISLRSIDNPLMVGIHTGGVWVAEQLHAQLGLKRPLGTIDITFYRDDFTRSGLHPQVKTSRLPVSIDDQHIILVDDILHSGRTVRAAMNEIFDYGRPASILLAVLATRDHRELPIQADVIGHRDPIRPDCHIKLHGPEPLTLVIRKVEGL
jgi:pyrimidine operon attenuation protein / uracil phosphoribosyltransferase